jgi:hypothetical protein
MRSRLLLLLPLSLACADADPVGPEGPVAATLRSEASAPRLGLMTQNMYVGTDVDALIVALASPDPADDFPGLLTALATLEATDFASRASAMADAIAQHRPHAVGLQEVSLIHVDLTGFGLPLVHIDFLAGLQAELAARGLDYQVAAANLNFTAAPMPGISLADSDVLLVDADHVTVNAAAGHTFAANLGPVAPGVTLERGYVVADLTIGGRDYRVVTAHPEADFGVSLAALREVQAMELAAAVAGQPNAIVMGDLNDVPGSPLYEVLTGAGFTDVWPALRPGVDGFTDKHPYDLSNAHPTLTARKDYIFARGLDGPSGSLQGTVELLGDTPAERVNGAFGSIWASDHAGVLAGLLLPRRRE